jgi:tRNA-2-methylthio-N6-dimethylallyladenosine synthase
MDTDIMKIQKEFAEKVKGINKNKKLYYYILTMGCKLNENDSEKLCGIVEQMGYTKTEDIKIANLYIINTCCVRENAEEKVFGKIRRIKKI